MPSIAVNQRYNAQAASGCLAESKRNLCWDDAGAD
jgi:hypothetical protein